MQLPIGIYAVSQSFEGAESAVSLTFQGVTYEATLGKNAFCCLDDLCDASLVAPEAPFCGYGDTPVVLKNFRHLKPSTVEVRLLQVIYPEEYESITTVELADRIYQLMAEDLGPDRVSQENA